MDKRFMVYRYIEILWDIYSRGFFFLRYGNIFLLSVLIFFLGVCFIVFDLFRFWFGFLEVLFFCYLVIFMLVFSKYFFLGASKFFVILCL